MRVSHALCVRLGMTFSKNCVKFLLLVKTVHGRRQEGATVERQATPGISWSTLWLQAVVQHRNSQLSSQKSAAMT